MQTEEWNGYCRLCPFNNMAVYLNIACAEWVEQHFAKYLSKVYSYNDRFQMKWKSIEMCALLKMASIFGAIRKMYFKFIFSVQS